VFDIPRYIQNSFHVFFPRQPAIRRKADAVEGIVENTYALPLVLPIPDDQNPEIPRIVFTSKTGYSQIAISQVNIALIAQYSEDFQLEIAKGRKYLVERVPMLFQILAKLSIPVSYCGFATVVNLRSDQGLTAITKHLAAQFLQGKSIGTDNIYDAQFKTTHVIDESFFSNMTVSTYQGWPEGTAPQHGVRISDENAVERGIQVVGDYNDRYAFNEKKGYHSGKNKLETIIDGGLAAVAQMITKV
jgi:hypothetical protein